MECRMKISLITITRNNGSGLARTLDSVYRQRIPEGVELEHIIIDGGNRPEGREAIKQARAKGSIVATLPPRGCYNAINEGIYRSSGDIIGLLHGNDSFPSDDVLEQVVRALEDPEVDFLYGNVQFAEYEHGKTSFTRFYSGAESSIKMLIDGIAPPHPSLYMRRWVWNAVGAYKETYRSAADFDYFARIWLNPAKFRGIYLPDLWIEMEDNGVSASWWFRLYVNNHEKYRALAENHLRASLPHLLMRYVTHFNFFTRKQR